MNNVVTVEGQVRVKDGSGETMQFYDPEDFVFDGDVTQNEALSIIHKVLIGERLKKKVDGYKRWRTCEVIDMKPTEEKSEDSEITRTMLKAVELNCVPVNIESYKKSEHKLKALEKAIESAEKRRKEVNKKNATNLGVVND